MSAFEQHFLKSIKRDDHGFVLSVTSMIHLTRELISAREMSHVPINICICVFVCLLLNKILFRLMRVHICAAECA